MKLICNGWPVQLGKFVSDYLKPNRRISPSAIRNLSFFEYPPNIMRKVLKGGSIKYPTTIIAIYKHFDELLKRPKDWSESLFHRPGPRFGDPLHNRQP